MRYSFVLFMLIPSLALARGSFDCSDADGKVMFKEWSANFGIEPPHGTLMGAREWFYDGKSVSKDEYLYRVAEPRHTGTTQVDAKFDDTTRVLVSGYNKVPVTQPIMWGERTFTVKLHFEMQAEPKVDLDEFVLCHEVVPPPAP